MATGLAARRRGARRAGGPVAPQTYALTYDHTDYLPYDPDDRDAYLCMGALYETLRLAAVRHGLTAQARPVFERDGSRLHVVDITLGPAASRTGAADRGDTDQADLVDVGDGRRLSMAELAADRHTNRSTYTGEPLPGWLMDRMTELGCVLTPPDEIARVCAHASALSWQDRRFVSDLERFCSGDEHAPRGMTPQGLMLARYEWYALRAAFAVGRLPGAVGTLFSARDIRLLRTAPAVAVLGADSLAPPDLFDAGRRLLRAGRSSAGAATGTTRSRSPWTAPRPLRRSPRCPGSRCLRRSSGWVDRAARPAAPTVSPSPTSSRSGWTDPRVGHERVHPRVVTWMTGIHLAKPPSRQHTVKTHARTIYRKLDINRRSAAVARGRQLRLPVILPRP